MRAGGFTLVEVMIVVAIIGLLIAVAVPNFKRSINKSRTIACHTQLQNIDLPKSESTLKTATYNQAEFRKLKLWFHDLYLAELLLAERISLDSDPPNK